LNTAYIVIGFLFFLNATLIDHKGAAILSWAAGVSFVTAGVVGAA